MNIGDLVREIHGDYEGIVRKVKGAIVEVEIEDGFIIPLAKSGLVVVSVTEKEHFNPEKTPEKTSNTPYSILSNKGVFLAFEKISPSDYQGFIINNTDLVMMVSLHTFYEGKYKNVLNIVLQGKSKKDLGRFAWEHFSHWTKWAIQWILVREKADVIRKADFVDIKLKPKQFAEELQIAPIINKKSVLIQLDQFIHENIAEATIEKTNVVEKVIIEDIVDLHIEKILKDFSGMSDSEIFNFQLSHFEKVLDQALAQGKDEITFIHGVGNGLLKHEIQRRVSQHKFVAFFKDAQKDKFGYGATLVKFK